MQDVDIANLALAKIGAEPIRSMADPTKAGRLMTAFMAQARDEVLRSYHWRSAQKRAYLGEITWLALKDNLEGDIIMVAGQDYRCTVAGISGAVIPASWPGTGPITDGGATWTWTSSNRTPFAYKYTLPSDCLKVLEVGSAEDWEMEGTTLYTDVGADDEGNQPVVRYIRRVTVPTELDPNLCGLIALKLALTCVAALSGNVAQLPVLASEYAAAFRAARAASAGGGASGDPEPILWTSV